MLVTLTSGKHTVTFTVEDHQDLAQRIMETIQSTYALPSQDSSPAMTYVDDEGDVINLNIGVAVEVAEARRIQGDVLDLTLLEPLPVLRRVKLIPDRAEEEPAEPTEFDAEAQLQIPAVVEEEVEDESVEAPTTSPNAPITPVSDAMTQIQAIMAGVEAGFQQREQQLTQEVAALSIKATRADYLEAETAKLQHSIQSLEETFTEAKTSWQEQNRQDAIALRDAMLHKNSVIAALETTVKQHADRLNTVTGTHAREIQDMRSAHDAEKKVLVDSVAEKQEQISTQQLRISDLEAENVSLREKIKAVFSMMQGCMDIATDGPAAKAGAAIDQAFKKVGAFGQTLEAACVAAKEEVSEAVQSVHNYSKAEEAKPKAKAAPKATSPFAESQGKPKATEPGFAESGIRTSASPQKRRVPGARRRVQMKRSAFVSQFDQSQQFRPKDRDAFERLRAMGFGNATLGQVAKAMRQNNDDLNRVIEQFIV